MRLIDADKLRESIDCKLLCGIPISPVHEAYNDGVHQALYDLDDAETVEAIPIEFLDKWFGNNYNAFTDLMMAWEKENGVN